MGWQTFRDYFLFCLSGDHSHFLEVADIPRWDKAAADPTRLFMAWGWERAGCCATTSAQQPERPREREPAVGSFRSWEAARSH